MFSFKSIALVAAILVINADSSAVPSVAAFAAAPLIAPAQVGYAHAVPQNIPPYAAQVNVVNKALSPVLAAPAIAAPLAAPVAGPISAHYTGPLAAPYAAPLAAPLTAPLAASPYIAGPGQIFAAPYAASPYALPATYAAPFPYAAAPLVRSPYGFAPTFVR